MQNTLIWFYQKKWMKGIKLSNDETHTIVENLSNQQFSIQNDKIYLRNNDDNDSIENLIDLVHLNEPTILSILEKRYLNDKIYTYTGPILIAVNPFKRLPLYTDEIKEEYYQNGIQKWKHHSGKQMKPHLFEIADEAYHLLSKFQKNCSILVSGESGAGKTESSKYIMNYLSTISRKKQIQKTMIEDKILSSNPILEAFGNAKTIRNNNSSRFGKFIKLNFSENGSLQDAFIQTYLLETVRVINQSKNERNFHIFYQLLSGLTKQELSNYHLIHESYNYLNQIDCNINDSNDYQETLQAMKTIGFSDQLIDEIYRVLSAILLIGNLNDIDNLE